MIISRCEPVGYLAFWEYPPFDVASRYEDFCSMNISRIGIYMYTKKS
jgi:hypothetical protein